MLCFVSGLITEMLLHGKFMGTFCSQTWIYFLFLFAHLCVCVTAAFGGHRHTHSSSAFGAGLSELSSPLSASVPAYRQMEICTDTKKRWFVQTCVVAVLQIWSSLTVKASWSVTLVANVPAIQTHPLQILYATFSPFLANGRKICLFSCASHW